MGGQSVLGVAGVLPQEGGVGGDGGHGAGQPGDVGGHRDRGVEGPHPHDAAPVVVTVDEPESAAPVTPVQTVVVVMTRVTRVTRAAAALTAVTHGLGVG